MSSLTSNKLKELLWLKIIDGENDVFKIALMDDGFTFNLVTHNTYADISAFEFANGSGYTTGGNTLAGHTVTKDDTNHAGILSFNNTTWTMSGADLAVVGAIIYDDTVAAPVADPVIAYIDFDGLLTTYDGGVFTVANISVSIFDRV